MKDSKTNLILRLFVILYHTSFITTYVDCYNPAEKYENCNVNVGCFGMPKGCISTKNCTILSTFQSQSTGNVLFTISSFAEENQYIALGLSQGDNTMGSDSVMFCYTKNDGVADVGMSWNNGYSNMILDDPHHGLEIRNASFSDGELYCEFVRDQITEIQIPDSSKMHFQFDLSLPYYLLLAQGGVSMSEESPIGVELSQHTTSQHRLGSENPFYLVDKYDECYAIRGCFGLPKDCIDDKNCDIFVSYQQEESGNVRFNLEGNAHKEEYISLALSKDDNLMGEDLVMYCYDNVTDGIGMSWNFAAPPEYTTTILDEPHGGYENESYSQIDGILSCTFTMYQLFNATPPGRNDSVSFDLMSSYFLLVAKGPLMETLAPNKMLGHHTIKGGSIEAIDFSDYNPIGTDESKQKYFKAHGCMMVMSWMFFACIGSLTARYGKIQTDAKILGKDLWFRIHQICMLFTWLLSIPAVLILFIGLGFNPLLRESEFIEFPHALIGLLAIIFTFFQPFLAFFRPSPASKKRALFNIAHATIGHTTILLALTAILLATYIEGLGIESRSKVVAGLFLLFFVLNHVIMTIAKENELTKVVTVGYIVSIIEILAFMTSFLVMLFKSNGQG